MKRIKHAAKRAAGHVSRHARRIRELAARRSLLEDLFQDYRARSGEVYKMNFIRGILFGLGSALGGTIVVALFIWLLFQIPGISDFVRNAQEATQNLQQSQ